MTTRDELRERILSLIAACADGSRSDAARDALLADLARYQAAQVAPYARFAAQRRVPDAAHGLDRFAALPTDAFRFTRIARHDPSEDVRCFLSSGTTQGDRSRHPFADLTLYDRAAHTAARCALFPDVERMLLVVVAPSEDEAPESSLSYMLSRFIEWFGGPGSTHVVREGTIDLSVLSEVLVQAEMSNTQVALLGTSFGFVHAIDELGGSRFHLPRGSRIMQTGGFKGKARETAPEAMRALLTESFDVPDPYIVAEYGMTELSSQLYETTLRDALRGIPPEPRRLWIPGWVRAVPVDADSLLARTDAHAGLLRVDDAANLDSVSCIQTADLARLEGDGIVLLGRASGAVARGCSITADALLGGRGEA